VRGYRKFILQAVSGNKNGVGYAPLDRVIEFQAIYSVKLLAMRLTGVIPAVRPSKETVGNKTYPVIQRLFFYWGGKSAGQLLTDFGTFCEERNRFGRVR